MNDAKENGPEVGTTKTLRKTDELIKLGFIDKKRRTEIDEVSENFSTAITPEMANLINKNNIKQDPIANQFVPTANELDVKQEELNDPIGDDFYTSVKGIIHRYPDRCLFKPVNVCPIYCRFCFRREKVGPGNEGLTPAELEVAYSYISNHPEIWEVIFTGGDPLIMKPKTLTKILENLSLIDTVDVIRMHTRVPVVDPSVINSAMIDALKCCRQPVTIVLHANHAKEFTKSACDAIAQLVDNGIMMLGQSVLLSNVNDNIEALSELMRCFIKNRVKPYYLHHGDLAVGTSHFRTSIEKGQSLMYQLRGRFSGICQPTYVLDIPGGYGKVPISHNYINQTESSKDSYIVEDYQGGFHQYCDLLSHSGRS